MDKSFDETIAGEMEAGKGRLLIVDDDPAGARMLRRMLKGSGHEVSEASSGAACLVAMDDFAPEVILLDIEMPGGIDGYETCRQIRSRFDRANLTIIFLSGNDTHEDRVRAYDAGGDDFVAKPFVAEEIRRKIAIAVSARLRSKLLAAEKMELEQTSNALLKRKNLLITRVNTDLQRFAEVTAHHLQEPARRIASYAELLTEQLGDRLDDAESRLSLQFISQQALRLQNLLRDVERYLSADKPRGVIKETDAGKVVSDLLAAMTESLISAGARISLGTLPPVLIDAARLRDLFELALENSLQHGVSEKTLHLSIDGERHGQQVLYRVSDNGRGIEAVYRERVFRVFEQLTSGGDVSRGNTGIGLALVRRIAESCGGNAWIEEAPGGGCCVVIELLIAEPS
jgi:DNA-binding response OmpR family regulator